MTKKYRLIKSDKPKKRGRKKKKAVEERIITELTHKMCKNCNAYDWCIEALDKGKKIVFVVKNKTCRIEDYTPEELEANQELRTEMRLLLAERLKKIAEGKTFPSVKLLEKIEEKTLSKKDAEDIEFIAKTTKKGFEDAKKLAKAMK